MNLRIASLVFLAHTAFIGSAIADQPDCSNILGSWKNQIDSTLSITNVDNKTGSITGTYVSKSGTTGEEYPLIGWLNKSSSNTENTIPVISFTVRWGAIGNITSWTGYCVTDKDAKTSKIITLWHLSQSESKFSWDHIITNSDVFTPKK